MRTAIVAILFLVAAPTLADPPPPALPMKVREVDHLRLRTNALAIQLERERLRAARAEAALAEMEIARLSQEGEALVAAFAREYKFDPRIDRYDEKSFDIFRKLRESPK